MADDAYTTEDILRQMGMARPREPAQPFSAGTGWITGPNQFAAPAKPQAYLDVYRGPSWGEQDELAHQAHKDYASGDKLATALDALEGAGMVGMGFAGKIKSVKGKTPSKPTVRTPPEVTGSKALMSPEPATVGGKGPAEWGPDEFARFGDKFGIPGIGGETKSEGVPLTGGRVAQVPRSFLEPGQPPSYYDALKLKAQGINPNELPEGLHGKIHDRMIDALQPEGVASREHIGNGYLFGMTSPTNPLTPNLLTVARAMVKSPGDINQIANMTPWKSLEEGRSFKHGPTSDRMNVYTPEITRQLGLNADSKGGMGTSGSADYTSISDMMKMLERAPGFFRFQMPEGAEPAGAWGEHVARIASQVPGLSFKTASLGSVYQSPKDAAISAMDRWMALKFRGELHDTPEAKAAWERQVVDGFNKERGTDFKTIDEMLQAPGGKGTYGERALTLLGQHPMSTFRTAKGEINPALPDYLKNANWPIDPMSTVRMSRAYRNALAENARLSQEEGRGLFSSQHFNWDKMRQRLEPHETMNPRLSSIGRMNLDQMKAAKEAHSKAGYFKNIGTVRPVDKPGSLAAFGLAGASAVPLMEVVRAMQRKDEGEEHPESPFYRGP